MTSRDEWPLTSIRWQRRHTITAVLLGAAGLGIIAAVAMIIVKQRHVSPRSAHQAKPVAQPHQAALPPTTPRTTSQAAPQSGSQPAKVASQVLLDSRGSGNKQTDKFTVAGTWDLEWSYDCTAGGSKRYFVAEVFNADGSLSRANPTVSQLGVKHNDVQHYHQSGTYYLKIMSGCSWHVTVKG